MVSFPDALMAGKWLKAGSYMNLYGRCGGRRSGPEP